MKFHRPFKVPTLILTTLIIYIFTILAPTPARADGVILPPQPYPVYETDQKALIIYEDGTEILVLSVNFEGTAEDFGWLIPVPNEPEVEKARTDIFDDLVEMTEQQKNLLQKILYPEDDYSYTYGGVGGLESLDTAAPSEEKTTVEVIEEKRVGIFDIAVLTAEKVDDLEEWMDDNGYIIPDGSDDSSWNSDPFNYDFDYDDDDIYLPMSQSESEYVPTSGNALNEAKMILQDYIDSEWYFIAVKVNNTFIDNVDENIDNARQVSPIRITFETSDMIFPMRISSISQRSVNVAIYTLTDSKNYVSNYDISGCDEDDYDDDYYYSYYEYPSENVCSLFEMTYGSKITSKQITDLTKEVGKGSWFESNSKMYLAKHYSSYLSYEDMTSDVLFEDQKNKKGLNDGTMTIVDWLKLPFTAVIYAPRNTLTSLFSNSSYYYGGSGIIVAIAIVLGLCFWSVVASVFWYFILTKTRRKFLRVLCYILQFPALWFLGLSVGVGLGVLCGLISTLVGIQIGATVVNSMIFGLQVSVLIPVLFYRFQWRRGQHKKGLAKVKKNEK